MAFSRASTAGLMHVASNFLSLVTLRILSTRIQGPLLERELLALDTELELLELETELELALELLSASAGNAEPRASVAVIAEARIFPYVITNWGRDTKEYAAEDAYLKISLQEFPCRIAQ